MYRTVIHGGSWFDFPSYARASLRGFSDPADRIESVGFRCVRSLPYAVHGIAWDAAPKHVRASNRCRFNPAYRDYDVGFRCGRGSV